MNSLAHPKCAKRLLMAMAAVSGIFLALGCGNSSSPTHINQQGFGPSNLTGTYVFSSQGDDNNGYALNLAGAFTVNGSGSVTGGTLDVVDSEYSLALDQTITSGSYTVTSDGRGRVTLTAGSTGTFVFAIALATTSSGVCTHGTLTEFDTNGSGSGTLDLQTPVTSLTAGNYAVSLAGSDGAFNPLASLGAFTINSGGTITQGVEDYNDNATLVLNQPLSGSATAGSGTGPGSLIATTSSFASTFDFFPIDATHWKLIETDGNEFLAGDAFSQASASLPSGTVVFSMSGCMSCSAPVADAGTMTSDGAGNFSGGSEDINNAGTVVGAVGFTGTYDSGDSGSVGGRAVVNLSGFTPATQWVLYPSSGGVLMMETDGNNVTIGTGYVQSSTAAPAASQEYAFNLAAVNDNPYLESANAQFNTSDASGGVSLAFTGAVDINDDYFDGEQLYGAQSFSGTFTTGTAGGEGSATTTAAGAGYVSFNYYAVDGSTFLILETDTNQVGSGSFQMQGSASSDAARKAIFVSTVHPSVHTHGAIKGKNKKK